MQLSIKIAMFVQLQSILFSLTTVNYLQFFTNSKMGFRNQNGIQNYLRVFGKKVIINQDFYHYVISKHSICIKFRLAFKIVVTLQKQSFIFTRVVFFSKYLGFLKGQQNSKI